jgi:hypothetical protein
LPTKPLPVAVKSDAKKSELFPFAVDMARAEHDPYFGPPVPYDPKDPMMAAMRRWLLGFAKAMDNPKYPCNPLITANAEIVGMNIKPLSHGDKNYTLWVSDGKNTCGMEAVHFENDSGTTLKGDFFQKFYLREMAGGFGYASRAEADEIMQPDKNRFWKEDIGEMAHDMVVNAFGQDFLNDTLPQQYSGFFVADAYNANYVETGHQYNFFTKNIVDASLKRTDMPGVSPYNTYYATKFQVHIQAEPTDSSLAFKVVHVSAYNNGFDPSKWGGGAGQKKAVRLR